MAVTRELVNEELNHYYFAECEWLGKFMEKGDLKASAKGRITLIIFRDFLVHFVEGYNSQEWESRLSGQLVGLHAAKEQLSGEWSLDLPNYTLGNKAF